MANGIITNVVVTGCQHNVGFDVDHGATTVQLMPYSDTPNNGGVYKVWATLLENYQCPLKVVNCGYQAGPNVHGFSPPTARPTTSRSRRRWRRRSTPGSSEDTNGNNYPDEGENWLDGMQIQWNDTIGGSNMKSSYYEKAST